MQTANVASRRVYRSHQKMFTEGAWTEVWVGLHGTLRLPASSKSGKLLPLRAGRAKGRDTKAKGRDRRAKGRDGRAKGRPGWKLRRGALGGAVHTEQSLPGSCLNHSHCLSLGDPNQK